MVRSARASEKDLTNKLNVKVCLGVCIILAVVGAMIGGKVGENIGINAMPPNAWAGDSLLILIDSSDGASWGALAGTVMGVFCCLAWQTLMRRRRLVDTWSDTSSTISPVWPSPPSGIGHTLPVAEGRSPRFQMRNVLLIFLGLGCFGLQFIIGLATLGYGPIIVMVICLPVGIFAKTARNRLMAWSALAGALTFWGLPKFGLWG